MNKYTHLINQLKAGSVGQGDGENINDRVLIVDGLNTFIRSYAASPVMNSDGIHVGGISGTLLLYSMVRMVHKSVDNFIRNTKVIER
jgi:5'-3' exonuclease